MIMGTKNRKMVIRMFLAEKIEKKSKLVGIRAWTELDRYTLNKNVRANLISKPKGHLRKLRQGSSR